MARPRPTSPDMRARLEEIDEGHDDAVIAAPDAQPDDAPASTLDDIDAVAPALSGFVDEYDNAVAGQRAAIHDTATRSGRGADYAEIIERDLDRTALRKPTAGYRYRWVFRGGAGGREGARIGEHEGNGFFTVHKSDRRFSALRPVIGILRDDAWLLGDLILMAETLTNYERRHARTRARLMYLDAGARAATVDAINKIGREEGGARFRDIAFDDSKQGAEVTVPRDT